MDAAAANAEAEEKLRRATSSLHGGRRRSTAAPGVMPCPSGFNSCYENAVKMLLLAKQMLPGPTASCCRGGPQSVQSAVKAPSRAAASLQTAAPLSL